jgi:predicted ATPase
MQFLFANIKGFDVFPRHGGIVYFCLNSCEYMPKRIVITGGPGTGKTSVIRVLEEKGYFCFHEVVRDFTLEAKRNGDPASIQSNPLAFVDDPFSFNQQILNARLAHYRAGDGLDREVVFYDRGIPDVLAYMRYFDQAYPREFQVCCEEHKYDRVVVLPPWEDIYTQDEERLESFAQAMEIHEELIGMYAEFRYEIRIVPHGTVEERADYIINHVIPQT